MSRADTGATRITDIDRNLLVASTELAGVDRRTIQQRSLFSQLDAVIDRAETIE